MQTPSPHLVPDLLTPTTIPSVPAGAPILAVSPGSPTQAALSPKPWNRGDKPFTEAVMGKTGNEQRYWIRAQLESSRKKGCKRSEKTMADYRRKVAQMDLLRLENGLIPMSAFGDKPRTFYARRAALIAISMERAEHALREMSRADKAYRAAKAADDQAKTVLERSALNKAWRDLLVAGNDLARHPRGTAGAYVVAHSAFVAEQKSYDAASEKMRDLVFEQPVPPLSGAWTAAVESLDIVPSKSRSSSKRSVTSQVQKRYPGWMNQTFDAVSKKWKTYTAVASVTGCRPEEIEGLRFVRDDANPTFLMFEINGAKFDKRNGSGIEVRKFAIREQGSRAFDYLMAMAAAGMVIVMPPKMREGESLKDVNSAFRNAINQAGKTFIRKFKKPLSLSPYCFRHSFACDIKANRCSTKSLAIALGHSTTKTQSMYGRTNDGIKGRRELKVDEKNYNIREPRPSPKVDIAAVATVLQATSDISYSEEQYQRLKEGRGREDCLEITFGTPARSSGHPE
jgi:integrase